MLGFCTALVYPFGPDHWNDCVPEAVELDWSTMVLPLQIGELLETLGAAGGFGSTNVIGPTVLEGHPFRST